MQQKLIEGRRQAFAKKDWSSYDVFVNQLEVLDTKIREEVLSIVLYKLEMTFDTFNYSLNHYISNKQQSTTAQYNLINQVQ